MLEIISSNPTSYQPVISKEMIRVLTAAVINCNFRKSLLKNPSVTIKCGFGGEHFHLRTEEKTQLSTINATSLPEFAKQLVQI